MHNLKSAGGSVDDAELVIREIGRLHAAWWGDVRLDQTPWLQMKGMMTPHEAPLVFTQNWERFLGKLSVPVTEELLSAGALCARYLPAVASGRRLLAGGATGLPPYAGIALRRRRIACTGLEAEGWSIDAVLVLARRDDSVPSGNLTSMILQASRRIVDAPGGDASRCVGLLQTLRCG